MNEKNIALQLMALAASMLTGQNLNVAAAAAAVATPAPRKRAVAPKRQTTTRPTTFNREPDGVKIIVDRPRRENYRSQAKWAEDMANYRILIDQAKRCETIKTRIPSDVPAEVHRNRRDWYADNGEPCAPVMPTPRHCDCGCTHHNGWGW